MEIEPIEVKDIHPPHSDPFAIVSIRANRDDLWVMTMPPDMKAADVTEGMKRAAVNYLVDKAIAAGDMPMVDRYADGTDSAFVARIERNAGTFNASDADT